ncbi:TPA: hypothetical protein O1246_000143 [Staphylococcus aureus]|nr:hypothetical protein [Staphylococcus aureus]
MKQITWHDLQHIIKDDDVIGLPALAVANLPAEVLRAVLAQVMASIMNSLIYCMKNVLNMMCNRF